MKLLKGMAGTLAIAATMMSGCIELWNPTGGDITIQGQWTVNGVAPTAASCSELGIENVAIRIISSDGVNDYTASNLRASCAAGMIDAQRFLSPGTYNFELRGLNSFGGVEASALYEGVTIAAGGSYQVLGDFGAVGANVSGSWTINGDVADATTCGNIATVRYTFSPSTSTADPVTADFPCGNGQFMGGVFLFPDTYMGTVQALDASGGSLGAATLAEFTIRETDTAYTVPNVDFAQGAEAEGGWTVGGQPASVLSCGDIAAVRYTLTPDDGSAPIAAEADCAAGSIGFSIAPGNYTGTLEALDATGAVVDSLPIDAFSVSPGQENVSFGVVDLMASAVRLTINLTYETAMGSEVFVDCATAGLTNAYMMFLSNAGGVVRSPTSTPPTPGTCSAQVIFEDLPADTYTLNVAGETADGTLKWGSDCSGITLGNVSASYECQIEVTP